MAGKFIAGTDAASALPNLKEMWKDGIAFSVDLLGEACVSDAELRELVALGRRIEAHYGAPQDIEWALDGARRPAILQARPITTL